VQFVNPPGAPGSDFRLFVKRANTTSGQWETLGSGAVGVDVGGFQLAIAPNGDPLIGYNASGNNVFVLRFSNGQWRQLGSLPDIDGYFIGLTGNSSNEVFALFQEFGAQTTNLVARRFQPQ
jgi:hypothetical protein